MERMSDEPTRWSRATIYPDMWADPDDDPRNSEGASPDGELATLQDFLTNYRMTLRMKCEGLDVEQLVRRSVPPSTMSLLGLLRHLAEVERDWRNWISDGDPLPKLYGEGDADFDGAVAEQAEVDAAYSTLEREQAATDAALAEHPDLSERLGKDGIAVRELMVHRIEEYARHCGHADRTRSGRCPVACPARTVLIVASIRRARGHSGGARSRHADPRATLPPGAVRGWWRSNKRPRSGPK